MSEKDGQTVSVSEEETLEIIAKYAEKYDLPEEVLQEIYNEEKAVVGMDRRSSIYKDVDSILRDYVKGLQFEADEK